MIRSGLDSGLHKSVNQCGVLWRRVVRGTELIVHRVRQKTVAPAPIEITKQEERRPWAPA